MYNKAAVVTRDDRRFVVWKLRLERNRLVLEHRVGPEAQAMGQLVVATNLAIVADDDAT